MSRADQVFRNLILTRQFVKGWGKPDVLKRIIEGRKEFLSNRENAVKLVPSDYPVHIDKERSESDKVVLEGHFKSPYAVKFPGLLPEVSETARFQILLPKKWRDDTKPVCISLAGTGDHGYFLRTQYLSTPLLKEGIGTIMLENPFYGCRKPKDQFRSSLNNVSDMFVLGGALMLETSALLHWCERQGYGPLCIHGNSMGGYMASLAASIWPKPVSLVPCLSWSTASNVYTKGVLSNVVNWKVLKSQFYEDRVYRDKIKPILESGERNFTDNATESVNIPLGNYSDHSNNAIEFSDPEIVKDTEKVQGITSASGDNLYDSTFRTLFTPLGAGAVVKKYRKIDDVKSKSFSKDPQPVLIGDFDSQNKVKSVNVTAFGALVLNQFRKIDDVKAKSFSKQENLQTSNTSSARNQHLLDCENMDFMRRLMDDLTHLGNYTQPVDTELIIGVVAKTDAYVPREGIVSLERLWPGCEIRYLEGGHIQSIIATQKPFRDAIIDSLERNKKKYYSSR